MLHWGREKWLLKDCCKIARMHGLRREGLIPRKVASRLAWKTSLRLELLLWSLVQGLNYK
jgi:hypothetical protein